MIGTLARREDMSGWTKVFLTIAGFALAMPVAAQAPAPTTQAAMEWPEVDCRAAKLTTTASQPRCQRGAVFETTGTTLDSGDSGLSDCAVEGWNVSARSPTNFGFAQLINVQALVYGCGVRYRQGGIAEALKSGPTFPTNGTGWSEVSQIGDIYTARFTSAGGENCKAFAKFGPPWASGFVWAVHGWLCGVQGQSVSDGDLQTFVDSLIIKAPSVRSQ
jgi:hypothetical protein